MQYIILLDFFVQIIYNKDIPRGLFHFKRFALQARIGQKTF